MAIWPPKLPNWPYPPVSPGVRREGPNGTAKAIDNRREGKCSNQLAHELGAPKMSRAGKIACRKAMIRVMLICVAACVGITIGSERSVEEMRWGQSVQLESEIGEIAREKIHEWKGEMSTTGTKEEWREIINDNGRNTGGMIQNRSVQSESESEENTGEKSYEREEVWGYCQVPIGIFH